MADEHGWGVIWDVDGTLVDTAELHFSAWQQLAGQLGRPFSRAAFAATFGRRNPDILRELFGPALTDAEVLELGDRKEELYRTSLGQGVSLLPGATPLLEDLRRAGCAQAIASSAPRKNVELILELTGTRGFFNAVVSMEDTSRGKPDPQVFQLAAGRLALPPARCLVLEDAVAGVEAARAAGMPCVAVTFVGHHGAEHLRSAGATRVVQSLAELTADGVLALLRG